MRMIAAPIFLGVLGSCQLLSAAVAAGSVIGWGSDVAGEATGVPSPETYFSTGLVAIAGRVLDDVVAVSAGRSYALALLHNGTVFGWGADATGEATGVRTGYPHQASGQVIVGGQPLSSVKAVSAGGGLSLALKRDGTVVAWGGGMGPGVNVGLPMPRSISNIVAVAAGWGHNLALREDGTVIGWGDQGVPGGVSNIVAIAAGGGPYAPNLAVRSNGTVCQWSTGGLERVPTGLTNVVGVAAGEGHCLALRSDGTVLGWGSNRFGEATGMPTPTFPYSSSGLVVLAGQLLTNVTAVAADTKCSLALRRDGSVVAWGYNGFHVTDVPAGLTGVVAIAAGENFCLAVTTNAGAVALKK